QAYDIENENVTHVGANSSPHKFPHKH
ncbi:HugZ family heme oxygenase, partial [Campylobacter jejuni]|nr:HugZ family heme oxygenase [Campylobacter jejuni]HEF9750014.1 HugZ family heme oxygenase [Campylobacter coli]